MGWIRPRTPFVENLRRGMAPKDAGIDALKRVRANPVEKRLLNARGLPNFGFYIVNARGEHASACMYEGDRYAVCTGNGAELLASEVLPPGVPGV